MLQAKTKLAQQQQLINEDEEDDSVMRLITWVTSAIGFPNGGYSNAQLLPFIVYMMVLHSSALLAGIMYIMVWRRQLSHPAPLPAECVCHHGQCQTEAEPGVLSVSWQQLEAFDGWISSTGTLHRLPKCAGDKKEHVSWGKTCKKCLKGHKASMAH